MRLLASVLATGLSLFVAFAVGERQARACGGFFCAQQPVDQSGERIVFALGPNHVTAYVQIAYTGTASDFSWVVPVSSKPTISVGSDTVFQRLEQLTAPRFTVDYAAIAGACLAFPEAAADFDGAPSRGGVDVLESGEVGPFNYVVLSSGNAMELFTWLNQNGFVQPEEAASIIELYVQQKMLFVAVKLKKDAMVGEIQPLVLDMDNPEACIPLVLTRIAAVPNMPVIAYVLADHRASPKNWFHVEPDLAKVNWLDGGSNYRAVATEAIDDAAGRGFVTEYAGPSAIMAKQLFRPGQYNLEALRPLTRPSDFIAALLNQGFPRDAAMQSLLRQFIPLPAALVMAGVMERDFYNNIESYEAQLEPVDTAAFIAALEERVVKPLQAAQTMFDGKPYLTRLLTTVSPPEMTRDPLFHINPDLPPVSNVFTAKAFGSCQADGTIGDLKLQLPDGQVLGFDKPLRPWGVSVEAWPYAKKVPAAKRIALVGEKGPPVYVTRAQVPLIDTELDRLDAAQVRARVVPDPRAMESSVPDSVPPAKDDGGCSLAARGGNAGAAVWLLALAAIGRGVRRARRRR